MTTPDGTSDPASTGPPAGAAGVGTAGAAGVGTAGPRLPERPAGPVVRDDAPPLPGTDERSFHFGLTVVVASLVWGLATYLIMTGLTPIVPRGDIVAFMIAVNIILIGAMIVILWVQICGLYKAWRQRFRAPDCMPVWSPCSR